MTSPAVRRLGADDIPAMRRALDLFAEVFEDPSSYLHAQPDDSYLARLLADEKFIMVAAESGEETVGALAAYELVKFEQQRSEIYIYDLGVTEAYRRRGIATALIEALKPIARDCGAWTIFVQGDHGDEPALALYRKIGNEESVLHFDILPGD